MSFIPTPEQIQYQIEHRDQSRRGNVVASTAALLVIAYVGVALRFIARWKSGVRYGSDDLNIAIALLFLTAFGIVLFVCLDFGFGKHIIEATNYRGLVICYVLEISFYCVATVFTKASILNMYCRLFRSQSLFYFSMGLTAFVVAYNVASLLVTVLECIPLSDIWEAKNDRCIDTKPPLTVLGSINVATGFLILVVPVPFVMRLNMDLFRKIQVLCVFATGGITCAFGIVRVVSFATTGTGDLSYDLVWPGIWAFCETSMGILAACLPTMGVFFSKTNRDSYRMTARSSRRSVFSFYHSARDSITSNFKRLSRRPRSSGKSLLGPDFEKIGSQDLVAGTPPTPTAAFPPVEPRFVLDIRIPSHSLQRSSANTDTLARFIIPSAIESARNSIKRLSDWNDEVG